MQTRIFLCAFALLAFVAVTDVSAQDEGGGVLSPSVSTGFLIGPVGGINLVAYNSDAFPIIQSEKSCFTAQNGSDIAPWGGATLEFPLGASMQNFIVGEVLYDSKSSKFTAVNGAKVATPTKINGVVDNNSNVSTALTSTLNYLDIALAYKYNFTEGPAPVGPGIQIGPAVGIKLASSFNKTVSVEASSGNAASPASTQTVSGSTPIDGVSGIRFTMRGQVTYDIPFTASWIATPTIGYDFPITKVDATRNWRASNAYGGIALRYYVHY